MKPSLPRCQLKISSLLLVPHKCKLLHVICKDIGTKYPTQLRSGDDLNFSLIVSLHVMLC